MPKATKLHIKGKSNTLQKPCKVEKDSPEGVEPEESMRQFQLELCWCIQQLERSLREKKLNEKQMQDTWKVLTVLKNNNQPIIRKRQLMRTHFGDYRAKMAAEEKKLAKMASKIKISDVPDKPKATFVRKSAFLTTGDNSFRFNFDLEPEPVDNSKCSSGNVPNNGKIVLNDDKTVSNDGKTVSSDGKTVSSDGKTVSSDGKTVSNDGKTVSNDGKTVSNDSKIISNDDNSTTSGDKQAVNSENKINNSDKLDSKSFKFSFSGSQFKFNFDVDK